MPSGAPSLEQADYKDFITHALARIPVHNPEWTNFNDSDPGVTLLQLFAFMMECVSYRANLIPERNHEKFLKLLGIPRRPAQAATGFVTFHNKRGPLQVMKLDSNFEVRAGVIPFRTTQSIEILPIEVRVFYKHALPMEGLTDEEMEERNRYKLQYADLFEEDGSEPAFYESRPMPQPSTDGSLPVIDLVRQTVDGCLWLALLARPGSDMVKAVDEARAAIAGKYLTIGIMPGMETEGIQFKSGQQSYSIATEQSDDDKVDGNDQVIQNGLIWEIATPIQGQQPVYQALEPNHSVDILSKPGLVHLKLPGGAGPSLWDALEPSEEGTQDYPPSLVDTNLSPRVITWVRLRVRSRESTPRALISWLGANATMVVQRTKVIGEVLGEGNGQPDQQFTLSNTPVIFDENLLLTVGDNGESWEPIDDLLAAAPEVPIEDPRLPVYLTESAEKADDESKSAMNCYKLDPQSGTITFGDGAHGKRPRKSQRIAISYSHGGGRQGNVNCGAVNNSPDLPPGFIVSNPLRMWGGADEEDPTSVERNIPAVLRHRNRLVSVQDFKDIAMCTPGVELGRVEVLPLYNPLTKEKDVPGVVTLIVIPRYALVSPEAPQPDHLTLDAICRHLEPRRLITTELHVRGPIYKDILISAGIRVVSGYSPGPVVEDVKQELRNFLSPLIGGPADEGWSLGQPVLQRELEAVATRVEGVKFVNDLYVSLAPEKYSDVTALSATPMDKVELETMELPRIAGLSVLSGDAISIGELLKSPSTTDPNVPRTPIPLIPSKC
jgi:hypothetical protein